jgi:hypothetical protein
MHGTSSGAIAACPQCQLILLNIPADVVAAPAPASVFSPRVPLPRVTPSPAARPAWALRCHSRQTPRYVQYMGLSQNLVCACRLHVSLEPTAKKNNGYDCAEK